MCSVITRNCFRRVLLLLLTVSLVLVAAPVLAGGYDSALHNVKKFNALFEFSQGNPKGANLVMWAVRNSYQVDEVKAMPENPSVVVVFHGPVVKLLSSNRAPFNDSEWDEVEKFQRTIREMKLEGVKFEVCQYAAKLLGVDTNTIIPQVDQVGNGFVSVVGYQQQGYSVVRIP